MPRLWAAVVPEAAESNINRRRRSLPRKRPKSMRKHITLRSNVCRTNLSILGSMLAESRGSDHRLIFRRAVQAQSDTVNQRAI